VPALDVGGCRLENDGTGYWTGTLRLPAWLARFGPRAGAMYVELPGDGDEEEPAAARVAGLRWLIAHDAAVLDRIVAAVNAEPRRGKIAPSTVIFHDVVRGKSPYVGFSFRCAWDREHGLGVMMHGLRVVEVGGADVAVLEWIARRDAKRSAAT